MADSGGLMIAANAETPSMPMFETVNVPPSISGWRSFPARARSARSRASTAIVAQALRVGLAEDGHDQAVVERDGDPDVGVGVVDVPAVDVGAVGLRVQPKRLGSRRAR